MRHGERDDDACRHDVTSRRPVNKGGTYRELRPCAGDGRKVQGNERVNRMPRAAGSCTHGKRCPGMQGITRAVRQDRGIL